MAILFQRAGWPAFRADWNDYDAYVGREVEIHTGRGRESGIYDGVDADGGLRLRQGPRTAVFHAGDVSLRVARATSALSRKST
jgi:BirA family biotin operon repressor/biotin-[acetyl-CoA-carboxylase] ligase